MFISSSGNIGIGTTTPSKKLTVGGDISGSRLFLNSGTSDTVATFKSSDSTARIEITDDNTTNYIVSNTNSDSTLLSLGANNSTHAGNLNISSSGNIGIGTLTPTVPLEVHKGDTTQIISDRDGNGTNIQLRRSGTHRLSLATSNTSGEEAEIFSNGDLLFNKSAGGNVGIGKSSPTKKLEVTGDISASGNVFLQTNKQLVLDTTNNNNPAFIANQGSNASQISMMLGSYGNEFTKLKVETSKVSVLDGADLFVSGNVGIGTSSPDHLLHISSSNGDGIRLGGSSPRMEITEETDKFHFQVVGTDYATNISRYK